MFKFIVRLAIVALITYGAYSFLNQDRAPQFDLNIPEVSYEEVVKFVAEVKEDVVGGEEVSGEAGPGPEPEATAAGEEVEADEEESEASHDSEGSDVEDQEVADQIPSQFNLAVPFTPQAPHANWELPYQEACEEAAAYMVTLYYDGVLVGRVDPDVADAAILEVVQFQIDFFGDYLDTTAQETAQLIDLFYNYGAEVVENPTVDEIKAEVAAGRPVIVPAAGRELGNPNYTGLGPLYHFLVIKGYTPDKFITNDPGTRKGENYVYDTQVIMDAMGDWNNGDPANGAKVVIFTKP
ncbi:C39 family peptidase [Patescibacteria group bacterium]|nr:C39 family peptidase [Patescibacteria group bacterium]